MLGRALGNRRWLGLVPLALLALALGGCASAFPAPGPSTSPTSTATPITPTPTRVLALGKVAKTGGEGTYLRWLPSNNPEDRMKAWPEGTDLEVVGDDLQAGGRVWKKVKDPSGNVGWIASEFVITATPTRTPSVTRTPTPTVAPTSTPTLTPTTAPTSTPTPPAPTRTATPPPTATPVPTAAPTKTAAPTQAPTALPTQRPGTPTPTATPTPPPATTPSAYKLALLSTTESKSVAFATVEGYVRNIGDGALDGVQVVVQYYSSSGQALSRSSAAIANASLGLGQSSYFKVLIEVRPDMARFTVTFLDGNGNPIPTLDSR